VIRVVLGDLAEQGVDAVVRAVRADLEPVNALSRDLGTAAGETLKTHLERIGTLPVGGAIMTPGGDLPADYVIHVVVMSDDEPQSPLTVQRAVRNGLRRASDWGLDSLALPPLGIGVGTLDADASARALVETLVDHLHEENEALALTVVVSSEYEQGLFIRLVDELSRDRLPS
jgi:O-acetyl-ADP-ribose deacetylase (regulator of RNase III)